MGGVVLLLGVGWLLLFKVMKEDVLGMEVRGEGEGGVGVGV